MTSCECLLLFLDNDKCTVVYLRHLVRRLRSQPSRSPSSATSPKYLDNSPDNQHACLTKANRRRAAGRRCRQISSASSSPISSLTSLQALSYLKHGLNVITGWVAWCIMLSAIPKLLKRLCLYVQRGELQVRITFSCLHMFYCFTLLYCRHSPALLLSQLLPIFW